MSQQPNQQDGQHFDKMPPPPYPGEPTAGYPHHQQAPPPAGWGSNSMPPPPPPYQQQQQYNYGYAGPGQATGLGYSTVTVQPLNPTIITTTAQPTTTRVVILTGGCPACRMGTLVDSYGFCAIFIAIFFFPIGVLCCLAMREKRCTNCGATF